MEELIRNLLTNLGLGVNAYFTNSDTFCNNLTKFTKIQFTCVKVAKGATDACAYCFKGNNIDLTYVVKDKRVEYLDVA